MRGTYTLMHLERCEGGKLKDILKKAAVNFEKMLDTEYHIVLGRKCTTYNVNIKFTMDSFFHLVGLQHLTDITFTSHNKERIYKDILSGKIGNDLIAKSVFYEKYFIKERIILLDKLEEMLDACDVLFKINYNQYIRYTRIRADYLCEYKMKDISDDCIYLFLIKYVMNDYKCCSFFKKHNVDFTKGTSQMKLLYNEKIINPGKENEKRVKLFQHKNYIRNKNQTMKNE